MTVVPTDAFILYNGADADLVRRFIGDLYRRGVTTYFALRDLPDGPDRATVEAEWLKEARCVVVVLGDRGWEPGQKQRALQLRNTGKPILAVLIGNPPRETVEEVGGPFQQYEYVDLRTDNPGALAQLVDAIRHPPSDSAGDRRFDGFVAELIDGNEEQRSWVLEQIRTSRSLNRAGLAARLAHELQTRFAPGSENRFDESIRNPKLISSIRSWMISCLIWSDEKHTHRELLLQHLHPNTEPEGIVRYWTLAGLYHADVPYLEDALMGRGDDPAADVRALAEAIRPRSDTLSRFREILQSDDFQTAWPVLRVMRMVPAPDLAPVVCSRFVRSDPETPFAYDALYALANPVMAREAAQILPKDLGVEGTVFRVIEVCRGSNRNGMRNFAVVLAALDAAEVDRALVVARRDPSKVAIAGPLSGFVAERRAGTDVQQLYVPGYRPDVIDLNDDPLNIEEDVQTLTAVIMAKEVKPPLAVGLFGDWGTGKSYFMQAVKAASSALAARAATDADSSFCTHMVAIEFNAWHYADTHLLASLVNHIFEKLSAHVSPPKTNEEQHAEWLNQRSQAQAEVSVAEAHKALIEKQIEVRETELRALREKRESTAVRLGDLTVEDFRTLLDSDTKFKDSLDHALKETGVAEAVSSAEELRAAISEANSARGRANAWLISLANPKNRWVTAALMLVVVGGIPGLVYLIQKYTPLVVGSVGSLASEFVAVASGLALTLRNATRYVSKHLATLDQAKKRVDQLIEEKREQPDAREIKLGEQVRQLRVAEADAAKRVSDAASRLLEAEAKLREAEEARSLARFLLERTRSDDYRKHLGVISTIRQDFESLEDRLATAARTTGAAVAGAVAGKPVDRIILYIDDLDRCPADKVLEVLQAVHLLLAYPLFVVIVGVDPRWLLHSLSATYPAFHADGKVSDPWIITPQNYLEKIFQIPFTLRPMTEDRYEALVQRLMAPVTDSQQRERGIPINGAAGQRSSDTQDAMHGNGQPLLADSPDGDVELRSDVHVGQEPPPPHPAVSDDPAAKGRRPRFEVQKEALVIRQWEADFAERLFGLIPTPRATKRFSNIYRMLKAPVGRDRLAAYEGSEQSLGEFQMAMLLLAISIGMPSLAARLFPELRRLAGEGHGMAAAMRQLAQHDKTFRGVTELEKLIAALLSDPRFPDSAEVLAEWVPRVARFSFDLGRSASLVPPAQ